MAMSLYMNISGFRFNQLDLNPDIFYLYKILGHKILVFKYKIIFLNSLTE